MTDHSDGKAAVFEEMEDGWVRAADGCEYETPAHLMWFDVVGGCGCGRPEEAHKFLCDCLRAVQEWRGRHDHAATAVSAIQGVIESQPENAAEFIAHVLSDMGITEHSGSVYGSWLTPLGKQVLEVGPMQEDEE